jgi:hypothetical protein
MSTRANRPYWLDDGTETCSSCSHVYVYEMECRCAACDRGICCHCVGAATRRSDVLCSECAAATEPAED